MLPPKLETLKLYAPLIADLYERNRYGDLENESVVLDGRLLQAYQEKIAAALLKSRMPKETERGVMHWYDETDSVNRKVHSAVFAVEERNGQLWGVAECRVAGKLDAEELETLKEYLSGQMSDGWGENFEQQEIRVNGGDELYVHLWSCDNWSIRDRTGTIQPEVCRRSAGALLFHAAQHRRADLYQTRRERLLSK